MTYPYFIQWMDPSLLAGAIYHFYIISLVTVHNSGLSITAIIIISGNCAFFRPIGPVPMILDQN